jgi:DNA-binding beta-propeller fold protein YncE
MRRVLVAIACAAVIGSASSLVVRAQGDGGYRLVPNWPTLPAGAFFGPADPKDKPTPPDSRIAEAAARRASGGARGGGGANAGGGGGRGGGAPVPLINQDITLPESPGGSAGQAQPGISGLAIDKNDLIYVFNRGPKTVMVFDTAGKLVRSGGDQEINGKKIDPSWEHSGGVDWDGNVYIIERDAHRILKMDPTLTKFMMQLGVTNERGTDQTHLNLPSGIAILHNGNIIVTDGYGNNRVVMYDKNGKFIKQIGKGAGGPNDKGTGPGEWNLPHKIAVDADENLYIIDREGHRVEVFDKNLNYQREIHVTGWNPWDINISRKGTDGIAFIADHAGERVHKIQLKDGKVLATWGTMGWGAGQFDWLHGIVVDSHGAVYAADTYGQRIQKFVPPGMSPTQGGK